MSFDYGRNYFFNRYNSSDKLFFLSSYYVQYLTFYLGLFITLNINSSSASFDRRKTVYPCLSRLPYKTVRDKSIASFVWVTLRRQKASRRMQTRHRRQAKNRFLQDTNNDDDDGDKQSTLICLCINIYTRVCASVCAYVYGNMIERAKTRAIDRLTMCAFEI